MATREQILAFQQNIGVQGIQPSRQVTVQPQQYQPTDEQQRQQQEYEEWQTAIDKADKIRRGRSFVLYNDSPSIMEKTQQILNLQNPNDWAAIRSLIPEQLRNVATLAATRPIDFEAGPRTSTSPAAAPTAFGSGIKGGVLVQTDQGLKEVFYTPSKAYQPSSSSSSGQQLQYNPNALYDRYSTIPEHSLITQIKQQPSIQPQSMGLVPQYSRSYKVPYLIKLSLYGKAIASPSTIGQEGLKVYGKKVFDPWNIQPIRIEQEVGVKFRGTETKKPFVPEQYRKTKGLTQKQFKINQQVSAGIPIELVGIPQDAALQIISDKVSSDVIDKYQAGINSGQIPYNTPEEKARVDNLMREEYAARIETPTEDYLRRNATVDQQRSKLKTRTGTYLKAGTIAAGTIALSLTPTGRAALGAASFGTIVKGISTARNPELTQKERTMAAGSVIFNAFLGRGLAKSTIGPKGFFPKAVDEARIADILMQRQKIMGDVFLTDKEFFMAASTTRKYNKDVAVTGLFGYGTTQGKNLIVKNLQTQTTLRYFSFAESNYKTLTLPKQKFIGSASPITPGRSGLFKGKGIVGLELEGFKASSARLVRTSDDKVFQSIGVGKETEGYLRLLSGQAFQRRRLINLNFLRRKNKLDVKAKSVFFPVQTEGGLKITRLDSGDVSDYIIKRGGQPALRQKQIQEESFAAITGAATQPQKVRLTTPIKLEPKGAGKAISITEQKPTIAKLSFAGSISKTATTQKETQVSIASVAQASTPQPRQRTRLTPVTSLTSGIVAVPKLNNRQAGVQAIAQRQTFANITKQTPKLKLVTALFKPPSVPRPRPPAPSLKTPASFRFSFSLPKQTRQQKTEQGFLTFVKTKGQFKQVGGIAPRSIAVSRGARVTDTTLSRTFKVVPTQRRVESRRAGYFPSYKFRTFQQRGGKRRPLTNTFIERSKFSLERGGEQRQIKIAKRNRLGLF